MRRWGCWLSFLKLNKRLWKEQKLELGTIKTDIWIIKKYKHYNQNTKTQTVLNAALPAPLCVKDSSCCWVSSCPVLDSLDALKSSVIVNWNLSLPQSFHLSLTVPDSLFSERYKGLLCFFVFEYDFGLQQLLSGCYFTDLKLSIGSTFSLQEKIRFKI